MNKAFRLFPSNTIMKCSPQFKFFDSVNMKLVENNSDTTIKLKGKLEGLD